MQWIQGFSGNMFHTNLVVDWGKQGNLPLVCHSSRPSFPARRCERLFFLHYISAVSNLSTGCSHQYSFKIVLLAKGVSKDYLQIKDKLISSHFTQLKGIKKKVQRVFKGLLWNLFISVTIIWIPVWFKDAFRSPATEVTAERPWKPGLPNPCLSHPAYLEGCKFEPLPLLRLQGTLPLLSTQTLRVCRKQLWIGKYCTAIWACLSPLLPKGRRICLWI